MMSSALRNRYLGDAVTTASPGRLLVMLYERLVRDLTQAETALRADDRQAGSAQLIHAQDIILELRTSLNTDAWDGAGRLAGIYGFLLTELIAANVNGDADRVASARGLVVPLLEAWQGALTIVEQPAGPKPAVKAQVA
ncbi:MAG: flagellar export chaperone FliS [Dactylosporangium sp.]|nr:flagellar export chaperone FliS [Dactylosporangium sp.]NNJ61985.1 flagellar export chaperone FliS [Dactylosporangium sp.]